MQFKSDLTREELMNSEPLFETCHPLEKLTAIGLLLRAYPKGDEGMEDRTIYGAGGIVEDAAEEIAYLIDLGGKQWKRDWDKVRERAEVAEGRIQTLERVLGDFISFLEDSDHKPDLKTMAANLRKKMEVAA
jgi:hypothetical protein